MKRDVYRWYDPWDMVAYAEEREATARLLEVGVYRMLRTQAEAHYLHTIQLHKQNERLMEVVTESHLLRQEPHLIRVPKP